MTGSAVDPTLLTTGELAAEIGVLLRYEVVDQASGVPIGKARRGTMWDLERRPLVRLAGRDENGWERVESMGEPVGWIRPAPEQSGDREVSMGPRPPYAWSGWIRIARADHDVGRIRNGQVTELRTKRAIATLGVPAKRKSWPLNEYGYEQHHGLWTMKFVDNPSRTLRIMSIAWLLYAWRMQRTLDNADH